MLCLCLCATSQGRTPPLPRVVRSPIVGTIDKDAIIITLPRSASSWKIWYLRTSPGKCLSTCCGHWRLDGVVVSLLVSAEPLIQTVQLPAKLDAHQGPLTSNTLAVLSGGDRLLYSTRCMLKAVAFRNPKYLAACRQDWGCGRPASHGDVYLSTTALTSPPCDPVPCSPDGNCTSLRFVRPGFSLGRVMNYDCGHGIALVARCIRRTPSPHFD